MNAARFAPSPGRFTAPGAKAPSHARMHTLGLRRAVQLRDRESWCHAAWQYDLQRIRVANCAGRHRLGLELASESIDRSISAPAMP